MATKDYILENAIISQGPPVRYRLTSAKRLLDGQTEEESLLRRCTFGKKDPDKPNKTILLVGETGAGKSTLINTIVNYVMGVKNGDEEWYEIIEETDKGTTSRSGTSKVTVYDIFGHEGKTVPYSVTIIDTPGYGDTEGAERDAMIPQKLLELLLSKEIQTIDAVGLVMKVTDNRLSDRLMYVFNSVTSLFGKDLENKIVALITHSDGRKPQNALQALEDAKIKCVRNEKNQPVHFLFNNCLSTKVTEETECGLEQAWTVTMRGMSRFTAFLKETTPQKLDTTVKVLMERVRLTACINNLTQRVEIIELKQREIQQTQEGLEKHKEKLKTGENFTVEVDEAYKEKEPIDGGRWLFWFGGAVTCNKCEENCHYPGCTLAWSPGHCEVMYRGRCTSCSGKCPVSDHVKEKKKYVTKTRKVKKTFEHLKKQHEEGKDQCENLLSNLQREKEKLEKETHTWLDEAYQHVVSLEEIALNVDSVSTHVHLDFLIQRMKDKGDTEKVRKLEEMKKQAGVGVLAGLWYRFGYVKAFGKEAGKVLKKVPTV